MSAAFQDLIPDNFCFGCGADNPDGLQIKSYWEGEGSICRDTPRPYHAAGPRHLLNGGIIAMLIDCHTICTAVADAYRREGREIDTEPTIWYVTGSLTVRYTRPAPIDATVDLQARITEIKGKKTVLGCSLASAGQTCAEGEVVAIRVSRAWREGHH